jgi:hypothetical protein
MEQQPTTTKDTDTLTTTKSTESEPQGVSSDGPIVPELPAVP